MNIKFTWRNTMVTQEQVDFFQENGYVKFGRVFG